MIYTLKSILAASIITNVRAPTREHPEDVYLCTFERLIFVRHHAAGMDFRPFHSSPSIALRIDATTA